MRTMQLFLSHLIYPNFCTVLPMILKWMHRPKKQEYCLTFVSIRFSKCFLQSLRNVTIQNWDPICHSMFNARISAFLWLACQGQPTVSHFQGHCLSSCSFFNIILQDYQLDFGLSCLCLGGSLATIHSEWSSCPKYTKGKCFPLR